MTTTVSTSPPRFSYFKKRAFSAAELDCATTLSAVLDTPLPARPQNYMKFTTPDMLATGRLGIGLKSKSTSAFTAVATPRRATAAPWRYRDTEAWWASRARAEGLDLLPPSPLRRRGQHGMVSGIQHGQEEASADTYRYRHCQRHQVICSRTPQQLGAELIPLSHTTFTAMFPDEETVEYICV